ncbi:MAG TPA: secretin N-terminal domain-containing protein [Nitrospiraceae bacterium]|nr:secretin N-terminal domain-containing protein [Nitrospiraceae bacterium]
MMEVLIEGVWAQGPVERQGRVTLDFNEVDLQVFVRFISELSGKPFVLDERVTGKITMYSPTKVTPAQAYNLFLSALEVRRLAAIPKGDVIQIVQTAEVPPERNVYVYRLKHALATDTAAVLTNLVARSQNPAPIAGGRPPLRPAGEFEAPVQIFADKATNALILTASQADYERLVTVIQSLDIRRNQVFVEAVIMEVNVNRLRLLGLDPVQGLAAIKEGSFLFLGGFNRIPEEIASIAQSLTGTGAAAGQAVNVLNTPSIRLFLQILNSYTDANILSTPQLLAADNQRAKIIVGENRPFPTGQAQGITGGTLVTIERKDVGVTLELTPQVLEHGLIRLEVKQEITAIAENVAQTIGSGSASIPVGPTTTKRAMETTTIVPDNQTVVIGGLVRDNVTFNERKIPLLGDIPLLGWLFKSRSRATEKLNLLVFLTPHVIQDRVDMVEVNARKREEMDPLLRENRIEESPPVLRNLDRLVAPTPVNAPDGSRRPDAAIPFGALGQPDAALVIDQDLLARLKRAVRLDNTH